MKGTSKTIVMGRVESDVETFSTRGGSLIARCTVPITDYWKDKNTGELRQSTEWHKIVMFGKLAETAQRILKKNSVVYFEGKNKTRKWKCPEGYDRSVTEIHVDIMNIIANDEPIKELEASAALNDIDYTIPI